MQNSESENQPSVFLQCSLYASAACGIPVLFTVLGIVEGETLLQILNTGFALLGVA